MKDIQVSVVIPCYNASAFIERCINSVLQQTYPIKEIICVDDGSADDTPAKLETFRFKSPLVKVIQQTNKGACAARNAGLNSATGEYIQFLDADDLIRPGKIAQQVSLLQNQDADLIMGNFIRYIDGKKESVSVFTGDPWIALIRGRTGSTCSNLFRRSAVIAAGSWNENQQSSQETELMFRMLKNKARVKPGESYETEVFFEHDESISRKNPVGNLERFISLRMAIFEHLRSVNELTEERRQEIGAVILGSIRIMYRKNRNIAIAKYAEVFRPNFRLEASPQHSRAYITLHKLFGFRLTEEIYKLARE
jgi:glycosyltransferase involved in cell wall biosynthesis